MTKEKALKLQAKKHLNGNWPAAVGATATILLAIMTATQAAAVLSSLTINLLLTVNPLILVNYTLLPFGLQLVLNLTALTFTLPLIMGYLRFTYMLSKDSFCDYSQIFYYCTKEKYFSTLFTCLLLILKNIFEAGLSFMPAVIIYLQALSRSILKDNLDFGDILWYYLSYALMFGGIVFFYILTKRNFLAVYFYFENGSLNATDVCVLSQNATFRFYKDITKLIISLLPMMLLCILIIPCLFVLPYILVTQATSAKWMIALSYKDEI